MKHFITFVFLIFCSHVSAQQITVRPATQDDFSGYWKLLPYSDERQPKILKESPWPGECQFFLHSSSGSWMQVASRDAAGNDLKDDRCKKTTKDLDASLSLQGSEYTPTWKYLKGHVQINFPQQQVIETWKIDVFSTDVPLPNPFGVELRRGDLAMQLVDLQKRVILWRRLLRRVEQVSDGASQNSESLYRMEVSNYLDEKGKRQHATFRELERDEESSIVEITSKTGDVYASVIPLGKGVCGLMIVREKKFARTQVIDQDRKRIRVTFPANPNSASQVGNDTLEWFFTRDSCSTFAF